MRILKVKLKDGTLTIEYALPNGQIVGLKEDRWDEFSVTYKKANPKPELPVALASLAEDCLELCELKKSFQKHVVTVSGVSFSYGGDKEVMGATITFQVKLATANCPLCLNTPHKASDSYNDDDPLPEQCLKSHTVRKLEELLVQTRAYIMGERGQLELGIDKAVEGEDKTVVRVVMDLEPVK